MKGNIMNIYIISYDLHNSEQNRKKVEKTIESMGEYIKCLTTTYFVKTSLSQEQVLNHVANCLDGNDGLIICPVGGSVSGQLKTELRDRLMNFL